MNEPLETMTTLLCAYLDISHVLYALEHQTPADIDQKALEETLDDIRQVYTGHRDLEHERDLVE